MKRDLTTLSLNFPSELVEALHEYKESNGVTITHQIGASLRDWWAAHGVLSGGYRRRLQRAWSVFQKGRAVFTANEVAGFSVPVPRDGDTWGEWQYNAELMVLTYGPEGYQLDLKECRSSSQTLDRIFQIASKKAWGTPNVLGDLLQALEDLLNPQANLCSFGQDKKFNVAAHLAALKAKSTTRHNRVGFPPIARGHRKGRTTDLSAKDQSTLQKVMDRTRQRKRSTRRSRLGL